MRISDWSSDVCSSDLKAFDPHSGVLRHQFFHGHAGDAGLLDDYALLGQALLALKDATGESRWLSRARQIADAMRQRFERDDGSLAHSADTSTLLIAPTDMEIGMTPCRERGCQYG